MNTMQKKLLRNMETAWNAANDIVVQMIDASSPVYNEDHFYKALYMRSGISAAILLIKHSDYTPEDVKALILSNFD
ncbi:MAG: hypothetical protein VB086_09370 [Clostridiaceae bacterium]|nr:hypothetical protein [Clostridiaceae bacterium]